MSEAMLQLAAGYEMVAAGLRALAESGQAVVNTEGQAEAADTKTTEAVPKEKKVNIEDVRAVLAEKSRAGKTQEVRNVLKDFGADKLSDIPEDRLSDVLKKAEAL